MEGRSGQNGRHSHLEESNGSSAVRDSLARAWEDERGPRAAGLLTSEAFCDLWLLAGDPPERIPAARLLLAVASQPLAQRLQIDALAQYAEVRVPKLSAGAARALVAYSCGIAQPFQGCSSAEAQTVAEALQEGRLEFTILGDESASSHGLLTTQAVPMTFTQRVQAGLALLFQLGVLFGALAAYYPTTSFNMEFGGAFMDDVMIRRNLAVVEESLDWRRFWRTDYWGLEMFDPQTWTHKSFRPFTVLTFRWNYLAHGFNSHGFYTTNVALHAIATLQLAHAGCHVFHMPAPWSVVLAALFAAHPVHTESICYVVGRADILCMQATLLSMAIYAPCVQAAAGVGALQASARLVLAMALLLVAGLCKETGFTFFGFFVGWEVLRLLRGGSQRRGKKPSSSSGPPLRILALLLTGGCACSARVWYTSGTQIARMDPYSNPVAAEPDPWVRFLSYSLVHGMYFRLLAWPTFLCYDYSMDAVPLVQAPEDVRLLLPCAGYLGLVQALSIALRHLRAPLPRSRRRRQAEAPILGIAIFALSFLPMMNVLFPIGTLVAERLLYIPSAGFLSAVVSMAFLVAGGGQGRGSNRRCRQCMALAVWLLLLATLAACWVLCYKRVLDWRSVDQITLVDGLKQLTSSRTQFNLANLYLQQQNYDDALAAYRRAIAADPLERDSQPLYHAGQILMMKGNYTEAEQYLQKAVSGYFSPLTMHEEEVWHDYGLALWHVGRGAEAIQNFHNSIITNPAFPKGYNNLACASVLVGLSNQPPLMDLVQQGLQAIEQAVTLLPGMALYWRNAAVLFSLSGNSPTALQAWERYRQLDPMAAASAEATGNLPRDCVWEFYFR